jgi:hypothetical protein
MNISGVGFVLLMFKGVFSLKPLFLKHLVLSTLIEDRFQAIDMLVDLII